MVRIITDSAADFEPAELDQMNITCIPLTVMFGDTEYQENVNLSKHQFYELLAQTEGFPKTSQASPQILLDIFEDAKAKGDDAIYITVSSALSGTYQSAVMVRNMLGHESCHVVDSLNATGGQRIIVEQAVRLRDEGRPAAEIIAEIEALRSRIVLYACMNTLEYLYRGGRISHTTYKLGGIAQIKPIILVDLEGKVAIPAKVMGMRRGMDYLCRQIDLKKPCEDFLLYVMYTHNRTNGEILAQRIREMGREVPDSRIINVGVAIGSHIGPDACGVVYVRESNERKEES